MSKSPKDVGKKLIDIFNGSKRKIEGILSRKPYDIGRDGTVQEFMAAVSQGGNALEPQGLRLRAMAEGAANALKAGKPENLQAFFAGDFDKKEKDGFYLAYVIGGMNAAQVAQAVETMPDFRRQQALDDAIAGIAGWNKPGACDMLKVLKDAGANVNAANGMPLYNAAQGAMEGHVQTLASLGADFDLSILKAKTHVSTGTAGHTLLRLELYKQMFADKDLLARRDEEIVRLQQEVCDLKARLEKLEKPQKGLTP